MNKKRINILLWLFALLSSLPLPAQNVLRVADCTQAAGKVASVPLYLDNSQDVVGLQFDITLPYAKKGDVTLDDARSNGHSVTLRKLSDTRYTVVVMSMENRPLRGNAGLLLRFPVQVPAEAQADDTRSVALANIVLTAADGHNIATATTSEATFTVLRIPTPDFVPTGLLIANEGETLAPGGQLHLTFSVENQGTGDAVNGWTEKVYLEDATGLRTFVGTQPVAQPLPAGEKAERSYELTLPSALKMEGTVRAYVTVTSKKSTDELIADQGNNSVSSANTKELAKRLFLSKSRIELREGTSATVTLTRSGDWTMAETFTLAESNEGSVRQLAFPAEVTIAARQTAASFTVRAIDNDQVNTTYRSTLTVTDGNGDGYAPVQMSVDVADDDSYPLTLTTDKSAYTEGDALTLTATIGQARESDLTVTVANTAANRFYPYVRAIVIPAGSLSASATTQVVDDGSPMADLTVTFTAQALGFTTSKQTVTLHDNDRPQLQLQLSRNVVSEGDGYAATMLTITRMAANGGDTQSPTFTENVTVYLSHNAGKELFFDSQYVIIPAGQSSVTVPVSVEDNSQIDGERSWTLTASACDASTGRPFSQSASARLTVTDDDTEQMLKLQCAVATLQENGSGATVTIERNATAGDLTVALRSDGGNIDMPATVTIKDGQKRATFTVKALATAGDDSYYVRVTAQADGHQSAQFAFMVSTKADATCAAPTVGTAGGDLLSPADRVYGGQMVRIALPVSNRGTASFAAGMEVRFYLKDSKSGSNRSEIFRSTLPQGLAAGETATFDFEVTMPLYLVEQQYYLMAILNPLQTIVESNYGNNTSATTPVYIVAPYTLSTIATDRQTYTRGQTAHITGQMVPAVPAASEASAIPAASAVPAAPAGTRIDVYLTNGDKRYLVETTLDADGRFQADYTFGEQAGGRYLVGACLHGTGGTQTLTHISVTRLKIERTNYLKQDITEDVPLEGDIAVTNLSEEPLRNISFQFRGLPADWTVEWTKIGTLQSGATGNAHYRIVATEPSAAKQFVEGTFVVAAYDDDGQPIADSEMPVYFWWYAATAKLMTGGDIVTTLYKQGQRTLQLRVYNGGLKETGEVKVEWPEASPWLAAASATLPSIAAGGSQTLTLTLTGQDGMVIDGTYESSLRLSCANSKPLVQKVKVTAVSTDKGVLTVDVVDALTLADETEDGPHVADASVRITNALTGEVAATGTTGADGRFRVEELKEGTYYVYATAPNHYYAEKTVTVSPGMDNDVQLFLAYETVRITYTVERTTITDEYQTVLSMDIVPNIPQAIVIPTLPSNWGTGKQSFSVRLTNKGRLTAYTPYLEFPNADGVTFTVTGDYPAMIHPNESYDVTVEFESPEDAPRSTLGYIVMHYAYRLRGETYWSQEAYLALMGRGAVSFLAGGGLPTATGDSEGRNFGTYTPPSTPANDGGGLGIVDDGGYMPDVKEPEVVVRDYSHSVDNRVRLQFEQKFALEREAFRGSLKVENLTMHDIEHVEMVPNVKTLAGDDASALFAISTAGTGRWSGSGDWSLTSSATGEATVLYVPSKETAPTAPVDYLFGGTVTYRDVESGQLVVVELTPTQLTVNPSPDLHLTYFVQRDIFGDDPTTDEVEPSVPAQFALRIENRGAGEALSLSIETSKPTIVDNQNNLPVQFTQLYCTVDGKSGNMDFNRISLGSIAGGQSLMARWWFQSNVMAHVANYDVRMTKHSAFGADFDLITLDGVRELTHAAGDLLLLNDIEDADDLPDHLIAADGSESADLQIVSATMAAAGAQVSSPASAIGAQVSSPASAVGARTSSPASADEQTLYTLTVTADREGWVYGRIQDPTNCTMTLVKVLRQRDGADVTDRLWQTDRTVQRDLTTIVDNRLHLADSLAAGADSQSPTAGGALQSPTETYVLYYEPKPGAAPQVQRIDLIAAADEAATATTATQARITFTAPVNAATVDATDVVVVVGDSHYDVDITAESTTTFIADWSHNQLQEGRAMLTVFTSGIENAEGTAGSTNKSIEWYAVVKAAKGDVNGDGAVDVADIATVIDVMAGATTVGDGFAIAADVNGDGAVDVADIATIIDIMAAQARRRMSGASEPYAE